MFHNRRYTLRSSLTDKIGFAIGVILGVLWAIPVLAWRGLRRAARATPGVCRAVSRGIGEILSETWETMKSAIAIAIGALLFLGIVGGGAYLTYIGLDALVAQRATAPQPVPIIVVPVQPSKEGI